MRSTGDHHAPVVTLEAHPWNTSFEWIDHSGPFRAISDDQAAAFDRDGFFVLDDLVDLDELRALTAEIDRFERRFDDRLQSLPDQRDEISERGAVTFTGSLVLESALLRQFASSNRLTVVAADLLGPEMILFWDQAVYKKSEQPRPFPWHQDNGYVYVEPQAFVTFWVALTDATVANGCPRLAPGLHRQGTLRHWAAGPSGLTCLASHPDTVTVEVPAGSAVVFSSLTPHMTGPNTTGAVRRTYILQYASADSSRLAGDPESGDEPVPVPCTLERQLRIPGR